MTNIILSKDQNIAFNRVKEFFNDDENPAITIKGHAGTGKTTLMKYIIDYIVDNMRFSVVAVAPTHKAKRVLNNTLNNKRVSKIPTITVASLLAKSREHSYIGTKNFSDGNTSKMKEYYLFIIDEISMIPDNDLNRIIDYICTEDKKLILIGDNCQIPSPSQKPIKLESECMKPDSIGFDLENIVTLSQIVRQASESPIIRIASYIRDHLTEDFRFLSMINEKAPELIISFNEAVKSMLQDFANKEKTTRIIAYTNQSVINYNLTIRKCLGYENTLFKENEIITGYNNVGYPIPVIENGADYKIISINTTGKKKIQGYTGLTGYVIDLLNIDDNVTSPHLFFIDVKHTANTEFIYELVKRAERVNKIKSNVNEFKEYRKLKDRVVFIEDIYKVNNDIIPESQFKTNHPLLFTHVIDIIDPNTRQLLIFDTTVKLLDTYGEDLINNRLNDDKPFSDGEQFADQFKVVEKDVFYGYAITAHKSQASTYDNVYFDETDFKKIKNRWNFRLKMLENRIKERNQLIYVACTRARDKLRIIN